MVSFLLILILCLIALFIFTISLERFDIVSRYGSISVSPRVLFLVCLGSMMTSCFSPSSSNLLMLALRGCGLREKNLPGFFSLLFSMLCITFRRCVLILELGGFLSLDLRLMKSLIFSWWVGVLLGLMLARVVV